jgi:phosphatidylserine/phosphatidylglycerophosphate/cardiolipin synthase-like enzyme
MFLANRKYCLYFNIPLSRRNKNSETQEFKKNGHFKQLHYHEFDRQFRILLFSFVNLHNKIYCYDL